MRRRRNAVDDELILAFAGGRRARLSCSDGFRPRQTTPRRRCNAQALFQDFPRHRSCRELADRVPFADHLVECRCPGLHFGDRQFHEIRQRNRRIVGIKHSSMGLHSPRQLLDPSLLHGEHFLTCVADAISALDQLHPFQAGMAFLADDDVVVHGDAKRGGDVDDGLGHLDVACDGVGSPEGVIVHQNYRAVLLRNELSTSDASTYACGAKLMSTFP
jgi:hypothetical protein